ncbi:MAG: hypothetical protein HONBIEJF_02287 [Fimbriimonadaceae bacterium]|nr:hypothetical protein [Fimbriimonadaceae bacterium]
MIAWLIAALAAETITIEATDDIWVYPHASDQVNDPFLRVWGADGKSLAADAMEANSFSYSYLRFAIPKSALGKKILSAKLVLSHVNQPAWDERYGTTYPLEVRSIGAFPSEGKWRYDGDLPNFMPKPGEEGLLVKQGIKTGSGKDGTKIEIDFGKGALRLNEAAKSGNIDLALASTMNPAEIGDRIVYKFYSRSAEAANRPKLVLTVE